MGKSMFEQLFRVIGVSRQLLTETDRLEKQVKAAKKQYGWLWKVLAGVLVLFTAVLAVKIRHDRRLRHKKRMLKLRRQYAAGKNVRDNKKEEAAMQQNVPIRTEFIKLDSFLKFCGACETGGEAKLSVQEGYVAVNGEVCKQRGRKLRPGDVVTVDEKTYTVTAG